MEQSSLDERYLQMKQDAKDITSRFIYWIFVVLVIVVMVFIQLSVLEFNKNVQWLDILVSAAPMLICTLLLDRIMYTNGTARGKATTKYVSMVAEYSDILAEIDGDKLLALPDFCTEYTQNAQSDLQRNLLKPACITYEAFAEGDTPIRTLSNKQLIKKYGLERARHIIKAKKAHVKGLYDYELTTENNLRDRTDVGHGERYNTVKQTISKALGYVVSTVCLAFIGVKDVSAWGWAGVGLLLLKIGFTLLSTFLSRNQGYTDIVLSLINHYARKIDILKQFKAWYENRPTEQTIVEEPVRDLVYLSLQKGNKVG